MHATQGNIPTRTALTWTGWPGLALCLVALTAARVLVLAFSGLDLHGDEAQYWTWSLDLDFGYYSKPPMIAWVILAATELCGNGAACVRLPSPLIHLATAFVLGVTAQRLYDRRVGMWTAVVYATLPAVSFSSGIISTDVPLLFFWSVALYALVRLDAERSWRWAVLLGVAFGLGLLSKYAMAYFALCAILYGALRAEARWLLTSWHTLAALGIGALILSPNIFWNASMGWPTLGHTADNAHWSVAAFHFGNMAEFLGAQFGVFGPILFGALLWRVAQPGSGWSHADRTLGFFSVPIIGLIVVQALISRAHANWAATAYIAATPLVVAWLAGPPRVVWLKASTGLHVAVAALYMFLVLVPGPAIWALGRDPFARLHGWGALAHRVQAVLKEQGGTVLLLDHRQSFASMAHELYGTPITLQMWDYDGHPGNQYELMNPFNAVAAGNGPVVLMLRANAAGRIAKRFDSAVPLGIAKRPDRAGSGTDYFLFRLEGYRGKAAP